MKILKNIILFMLLAAAVSVAGYSFYLNSLNACERPLEYSIGRFDAQFGISEEDLNADLREAAAVWKGALGRDIFVYDPDAPFKINLIYDERQIATIQKQRAESGISVVETVFKASDAEFRAFKKRYDQRVAVYEKEYSAYEGRKLAYDREVALWNGKGGAPKEKYEALEFERQYLNAEAQRLNEEVSSLKQMADELNGLLAERNIKAADYNKIAQSYNNKYNEGLEFNQAEYNGREINVYQFGSRPDLVLALAHEFGHALDMEHVDNPQSVMYYLTSTSAESAPTLSAEDLAELKRVCEI